MSATRLLILGVIRIMQPVHGYDIRRELLSWRADEWASVAPGSVYSQIKTLHRDGLIQLVGTEQEGLRPERTVYEITGEGEKEFAVMLNSAWRTVKFPALPLGPAITMFPFFDRAEMIDALGSRILQLEAAINDNQASARMIGGDPAKGGIPDHVREMNSYVGLHLEAEIAWTRNLLAKLQAGEYYFANESGGKLFDEDSQV